MFTKEEFEGKINEIKGGIKQKWGELTDDELQRTKGNGQSLFGVIQQKFGAKKEEVESYFHDLKQSWTQDKNQKVQGASDAVNSKIDEAKNSLKNKH